MICRSFMILFIAKIMYNLLVTRNRVDSRVYKLYSRSKINLWENNRSISRNKYPWFALRDIYYAWYINKTIFFPSCTLFILLKKDTMQFFFAILSLTHQPVLFGCQHCSSVPTHPFCLFYGTYVLHVDEWRPSFVLLKWLWKHEGISKY